MSQKFSIKLFNRYTQNEEVELVYGQESIEFAYNSLLGKALAPVIGSRLLSQIYGSFQDKESSRKKVPQFLKDFHINTSDYENGSIENVEFKDSFKNFNEFFIRKFKEGRREFIQDTNLLSAFAEARYYGYEKLTEDFRAPVKGYELSAEKLLENKTLAKDFMGGPVMIARLCPVDYHRYHYPDSGVTSKNYLIKGDFHSVNPLALLHRKDIFVKNERRVSILETENFGKMAYIEVGATCVGKIIQSFDESKPFKRGDEKGYFLFGGSTVIVLGEAGKWSPSSDILLNTKKGIETYIHLGDEVGAKI